MADSKISDLTALTTAATGDLLVIVDISDTTMAASGTDKQITAGELLISGLPGAFTTLEASGLSTLTGVNATNVDASGVYKVAGVQILTTQQSAIADATGGLVDDAEARTAINSLLAACRAHGIIDT